MKINVYNMRYSSERRGITIYLLPTFQLIFNEYGECYNPNWQLNIRFIWFMLSIYSSKNGRAFKKWFRNEEEK